MAASSRLFQASFLSRLGHRLRSFCVLYLPQCIAASGHLFQASFLYPLYKGGIFSHFKALSNKAEQIQADESASTLIVGHRLRSFCVLYLVATSFKPVSDESASTLSVGRMLRSFCVLYLPQCM